MKDKDLDKVLNYMKQYVENKYEHNSEPMLTWKDLKLVLNEINRLNNIINELEKCIDGRIIRTKKEPIREKERNRILYNLAYILDKLQELKGEDKK